MLRKLMALMAVLLTGALVGCEVDGGADADSTTQPDTEVTPDQPDPDTTPQNEYKYVRIDDLSPEATTPDGGSDIDAITLFKAGVPHYATNVEFFEHGGGLGEQLDPTEALGAPDAFVDYPDLTTCDGGAGYVSLGGVGGTLIVLMDANIEAGNEIEVLEVGGCEMIAGGTARVEEIKISVSVGKDPVTSQWIEIGQDEGPAVSFIIPALP